MSKHYGTPLDLVTGTVGRKLNLHPQATYEDAIAQLKNNEHLYVLINRARIYYAAHVSDERAWIDYIATRNLGVLSGFATYALNDREHATALVA